VPRTKLHKRWADGYTLISLGFAVLLVAGLQFFLDRSGIAAAERTGVVPLIVLAVVLAAIWQAVGLGIALENCWGAHDRQGH
jgi:hypothetical protein